MWNDRKKNIFRVIEKSYARYKKDGYNGMISRLNQEYIKLYPETQTYRESDYNLWISQNEKDIFKSKKLVYNPLVSIYYANIQYR